MKKYLLLLIFPFLFGCTTFVKWSGQLAEVAADFKVEYCAELDANARQILRDEYNALMDERGLPHDQINCPGDA